MRSNITELPPEVLTKTFGYLPSYRPQVQLTCKVLNEYWRESRHQIHDDIDFLMNLTNKLHEKFLGNSTITRIRTFHRRYSRRLDSFYLYKSAAFLKEITNIKFKENRSNDTGYINYMIIAKLLIPINIRRLKSLVCEYFNSTDGMASDKLYALKCLHSSIKQIDQDIDKAIIRNIMIPRAFHPEILINQCRSIEFFESIMHKLEMKQFSLSLFVNLFSSIQLYFTGNIIIEMEAKFAIKFLRTLSPTNTSKWNHWKGHFDPSIMPTFINMIRGVIMELDHFEKYELLEMMISALKKHAEMVAMILVQDGFVKKAINGSLHKKRLIEILIVNLSQP